MTYPESVDPRTEHELAIERRVKLLNLNNPSVFELWTNLKDTIEPVLKPGTDINQVTENLLILSLMHAYKDQLSGLPNKARIRIEVEAAMAVADRLDLPVSVIFMDGKGFKEVNDRLGHNVGDQVIEAIGQTFDKSVQRSTDITLLPEEEMISDDEPSIEVGREGGDEFVAILVGADEKGALVVAGRMSKRMADAVNQRVPNFQEDVGRPFDVSVGIARYNPNIDKSGVDLIKRADADLTRRRQELGESRRS